jgi:hypothetical protein
MTSDDQSESRPDGANDNRAAILRVANSHAGLMVTGSVFLLVGIRTMAVANWSVDTFSGLLAVSNPLSALLPATISLIGGFAPFTFYLAILVISRHSRPPWLQSRLARFNVALVALVPAAVVSPWSITLLGISYGLLLLWAIPAQRRDRARTIRDAAAGDEAAQRRLSSRSSTPMPLLVIGVLLLSSFALNDRPWMPAEELVLEDGRVVVGYVVAVDDDDIVLLRESDRALTRLSSDQVEGRKFCTLGTTRPPVIGLLMGPQANYPKCATA